MDVWIEMDVYLSVLIMIISEIGVGTVGTSVVRMYVQTVVQK